MRYIQASGGGMLKRQSTWLISCRKILTAATIWVFLAVPVAAAISAIRLSLMFVFVLKEMSATAAILGATHGLWVVLASESSRYAASSLPGPTQSGFRWFGAISGGVLGLLGFLPVYSSTSVNVDYPTIMLLVAAAICGGGVAGVVFCSISLARLPSPPVIEQSLIVGSLLVLAIAAIEYAVYWNPTVDRLPLLKVEVANLSAGDAKGTDWSDCYEYFGIFSDGGGAEGGPLVVKQKDGRLEISGRGESPARGGISQEGRFRAGGETSNSGMTFRTLWEGRFGSGFVFTKRTTTLGGRWPDITTVRGVARRSSCRP
jgi:hypothetical protein